VWQQILSALFYKSGVAGFTKLFYYFKPKGGFVLSKVIKERMVEGELDRGFIIGNTGMIDLHTKMECYKNGMDNYLSLPLDLLEVY
jgi:hypothetical protein